MVRTNDNAVLGYLNIIANKNFTKPLNVTSPSLSKFNMFSYQ